MSNPSLINIRAIRSSYPQFFYISLSALSIITLLCVQRLQNIWCFFCNLLCFVLGIVIALTWYSRDTMWKIFNKTFFKFLIGFAAIILISITSFMVATYFNGQESVEPASTASMRGE